jgi:hypothetical protein
MTLPEPPLAGYVRAVLLAGVQAFFIAEPGFVDEIPNPEIADLDTSLAQFP